MAGILAVVTDNVDPEVVPTHRNTPLPVVGVVGHLPGSGGPVLVGKKRLPAATVGDPLKPHGNPSNPKLRPGYNPECAKATIAKGSSTVFINGWPAATIGSLCTCTHTIAGPGEPTILIGGV
jgi:uncharacterized Zn-binding protein involved in type VI secretion